MSRSIALLAWTSIQMFNDRKKHMEALGYLPEPIMADVKVPVTADIAAPILRETVSRVVDGKVVTMYKDELEKILYKDLYSHLGLQIGG